MWNTRAVVMAPVCLHAKDMEGDEEEQKMKILAQLSLEGKAEQKLQQL